MINVLIADDHRIVAEGLTAILDNEQDIYVEGIASAIGEAVVLVEHLRPQLLLLDVGMPDGDGIDAIPTLKAAQPRLRILILTMYAEAAVIQRALDNGAEGYILKSADREELILGIDTVAAGGTYVCKEAKALLMNSREAAPELTQREREVLRLVVEGRTIKEIAEQLCLGFETVHSYTKYIRKKLGCANTASLVRKAIEQHLV